MTVRYDPAQGLDQVCAGLKRVAFDPQPNLNGFAHPVSAPPLAAGMVYPPAMDLLQAMSHGAIQLNFELWVMVGSSAGFEQQQSLWPYMNWAGSSSIAALIAADRSLGIVGSDGEPRVNAHVAGTRPLGFEEIASLETMGFGVAFLVPVIVTNKE